MSKLISLRAAVSAVLCITSVVSFSPVAKSTFTGLPSLEKAKFDYEDRFYGERQQYIVMFKQGTTLTQMDTLIASIQSANKHTQDIVRYQTIGGFTAALTDAQYDKLANDPLIDSIEENGDIEFPADPLEQRSFFRASSGGAWGIDRIDQDDLPLNGDYSPYYDGAGSHVYVLGSGIHTSHVEFSGRASWAYTASTVTDGDYDGRGHGTHMAATVAGKTWGVARQANVYAVKVMNNSGVTNVAGLIEGLEWVANNRQTPAIALVAVSISYSAAVNQAVEAAIDAGVTVVVPSGDSSMDACNYSPASVSGAVTVAATWSDDRASVYSNKGECVDIYAPGLYIKSAWSISDYANNSISHSPMAAAHVAGAAALIRGNDPFCNVEQVNAKLYEQAQQGKLTEMPNNSPNRFVSVLTSEDTSPSCTVPPSCDAILADGLSNGDGMYFIDPDGHDYGVDPFEVYCDMTTQGGGWTLFSHHSAGNTVIEGSPVMLGIEGTLNDERWDALRSTLDDGMMFIDNNGLISMINADTLWSGNCKNIGKVSSLLNNTCSWGRIWHDEGKTTCAGNGLGFAEINIGPDSVNGAKIYNYTNKFELWPYSGVSSNDSATTLSYFIK